jgi:diadenosine tetraphosphate (Ap4A) HIT family hydrolase
MPAMADQVRRAHLDLEDYARRSQANACFICKIVDGTHHFPHGEIYRDDFAVVFLNRFPTLLGYTLVAPREHRISVIEDFTEDEHLRIQLLVHRVGRAIAASVPTERLYVMSLGSNQGNAHVHWHLAPLPPGVPYEEQQFAALMMETKGYIDLSPAEHNELAGRIRSSLGSA